MKKSARRYIENVRMMDDFFFEVFFKDQPQCIEVVIYEIFKQLGYPLVKVKEVEVQKNLNALDKRTVRLDALAVDEQGNHINIEVQRVVSSNLKRRARYHSALLDTNSLEKNCDFSSLNECYVIFITEKDFKRQGLPAYQIERICVQDNTHFGDGTHTIFVNGEYRGEDPIGKLMHDFSCKGADEMKNETLAKRMRFFKETGEGERELSGIELEIAEEAQAKGEAKGLAKGLVKGEAKGVAKGRKEAQTEMAAKLIRRGQMSLEAIAEVSELPIEQLREIKLNLSLSV